MLARAERLGGDLPRALSLSGSRAVVARVC